MPDSCYTGSGQAVRLCEQISSFMKCTESLDQLSDYQFSLQEIFAVMLLTWTMRF
jgi:hypothetical protein